MELFALILLAILICAAYAIIISFVYSRKRKRTLQKNRWPKNPKLFKDIELSLHNNDPYLKSHRLITDQVVNENNLDSYKVKLACPNCDGVLSKRLNKGTHIEECIRASLDKASEASK